MNPGQLAYWLQPAPPSFLSRSLTACLCWNESNAALPCTCLTLSPGPQSCVVWAPWVTQMLLQHLSLGFRPQAWGQWWPHYFLPSPPMSVSSCTWITQGVLSPHQTWAMAWSLFFSDGTPVTSDKQQQQERLQNLPTWPFPQCPLSLQGGWSPLERIFIYPKLCELCFFKKLFQMGIVQLGTSEIDFWSWNYILGPTLILCYRRSLKRAVMNISFSHGVGWG